MREPVPVLLDVLREVVSPTQKRCLVKVSHFAKIPLARRKTLSRPYWDYSSSIKTGAHHCFDRRSGSRGRNGAIVASDMDGTQGTSGSRGLAGSHGSQAGTDHLECQGLVSSSLPRSWQSNSLPPLTLADWIKRIFGRASLTATGVRS